jgi:hypothetical protein
MGIARGGAVLASRCSVSCQLVFPRRETANQEILQMRLRDYFRSESAAYRHLCPEKRQLRVQELWVGVGFGLFSSVVVMLAFLVRMIHDNPHWFLALPE